jgi:glycine/D-amino acid oxidase-like deaminating enzyme
MTAKTVDTLIIGAGVSGLSCAKLLNDYNNDFLLISQDIGGRIFTSKDGTVNYGAFFVCEDYDHVLQHVTLKSRIKFNDFCFHENNSMYGFFHPKIWCYMGQFMKAFKILYKFRKSFRRFRKNSEIMSQKSAIENDPFLYQLYMQNAADFVNSHHLEPGTKAYYSKALYSTTFSRVHEMNALSFLQYLLPLITPIYTFTFEKETMTEQFQKKIVKGTVTDIKYKNKRYKIKNNKLVFSAKNIVLATQIDWSHRFANVTITNKPVCTKMVHITGVPKTIIQRKKYHFFSYPSNVQAIADLTDGSYLFYYRQNPPPLKHFFHNPQIIAQKSWDPAGTINGHILIDSDRGNNMYLIGDYNVVGLEESYITGIYCANRINQSQ